MSNKDKIELARNILNNAYDTNVSKEIVLKLSRKVDDYIVDYYKQNYSKINKDQNQLNQKKDD